jgi:hypothetical protein
MKQNVRTHKLIKGLHLLVIAALLLVSAALLMLMPGPAPAEAAAATTTYSTSIQPGQVSEGLTAEAWASIQSAVERDRYRFRPAELPGGEAYQAPNYTHDLQATFTPEGVEVAPRGGEADWRWGLHLLDYGYGDKLQAVSPAELVVAENRLEYRWGPLVEWYVNDHRGLEQGSILQEPPPGRESGGAAASLVLLWRIEAQTDGWGNGH